MEGLERLLENNRAWSDKMVSADPNFFKQHADGQAPEYLWIGCSDSRVVANTVTNMNPGDIFVHRNVGNVVLHADLNCMSVLEYSIRVLKVKHVVVCGHYNCGAVKGALQLHSKSSGLVNCWISHIRDVRNRWALELQQLNGDTQVSRLCELNAMQQTFHVCTSPPVQASWDEGQELHIHCVMYDLKDGRLKKLIGPISSMEQAMTEEDIYASPKAGGPPSARRAMKQDMERQISNVKGFEEKLG